MQAGLREKMLGQVLWKLLQTPGVADLSRKEAHTARFEKVTWMEEYQNGYAK